MKTPLRYGLCSLLTLVLAVPVLLASGLLEMDERRLTAAKTRHTQQLTAASQAFHSAVERANAGLTQSYEQVIRGYEQRGQGEVVEQLRAELQELIDASFEPVEIEARPARRGPPGHVNMIRSIGPALVTADNRQVPTASLAQKDYVMLYFSAGWCGPCRAFTPRLESFYKENASKGNFEVVLVSSDRSAADMTKYMSESGMTFPAIPFDRISASKIQQDFRSGRGIPDLVLVDRQGKIVSASYVDGKYLGPNKVLTDMQALIK